MPAKAKKKTVGSKFPDIPDPNLYLNVIKRFKQGWVLVVPGF